MEEYIFCDDNVVWSIDEISFICIKFESHVDAYNYFSLLVECSQLDCYN